MDVIIRPMEFTEAVERTRGRLPTGSALDTAGWAEVPLAIRERAFFTARMEDARIAAGLQERVLQGATKGEFVAKARQFLSQNGIPAATRQGDVRQMASTARLELIFNHHTESARAYGAWKQGQDPDVLDAFPAQEFLRVESREAERADWPQRWAAAGGRTFGGRMIALKSDPVWAALSRFGTPWPPFDFGSGMGVEDVERGEAEALGLIQPGEAARGDEKDFNAELSASVRGLPPNVVGMLREAFARDGAQVAFQGGSVWMRGDAASRRLAQPQGRRSLADLAPSEREAVVNYTRRDVGLSLNTALRSGAPEAGARAHAQRLDAALQRLPTVGQREVIRRVGPFEGLAQWRPGTVITEAGFTSASVVDRAGYGAAGGARIVIRQRTAVDISPVSVGPEDREVLFRRPLRLRITDRRLVDGVDTIFAEELP